MTVDANICMAVLLLTASCKTNDEKAMAENQERAARCREAIEAIEAN